MTATLSLTPSMIAVLGVLALTLLLFASEIVRVDVAAVLVMVLLGLSGLVGPEEVFSGFASNAVISIIAVMILGAALDKTGLMNRVAQPIVRLAGHSEARLIALVSAAVGLISSFMQNIAAAALFLPSVNRIALRTRIPISRLLMPMGFCAILGGTVTLVGSSPLILLNDLVDAANRSLPQGAAAIERFGLFEVTPIGLTLIAVGIAYFIVFGRYVLPALPATATPEPHTSLEYLERTYNLQGGLYELVIPPGSELVGRDIDALRAASGYRLSAVALQRDRQILFAPPRDTVFAAGDVLGIFGHEAPVREFAARYHLELRSDLHTFAEAFSPTQSGIAELIITPRSALVGKTMREVQFRRRYRATLLAIHRAGTVITQKLSDVPFQSGDALLVHCRWEDLALLDKERDFLVITDYPTQDVGLRPHKARYALAFFGLSLTLVLLFDMRLSLAFMAGAIGVVVSGVLRIDEAYQAVDWRTVFLLASLIPLGIAVEQTGTATWIAQQVLSALGTAPAWALLAAVVALTTVFSLLMSNVGATVLLVPLAMDIAHGAGADPRLFALAVGLAASNAFLLPTHQVNALIMGAGGYRNRDFLRAGGIMTLLFMVVVVTMLMLFY